MRRQSRIRKEPVMGNGITYVGLDAHKNSINVAMLLPRRRNAVEWKLGHDARALKQLVRKLEREAPGKIRCCYEAGPVGYALKRKLESLGKRIECAVIAPSLIPVKPGERIKTDRRDAKKLAELHRGELLTEVHAPTAEDEAVRDLVRCRDDAKEDIMRARHRLSKLLLRRGLVYTDGKNWTKKHKKWLLSIQWEHDADKAVFDDYLLAIENLEERLNTLAAKIAEVAETEPYREPVAWLRCFRGIDTLSAMVIVAELHDFRRFTTPRALMAYLGLVPGERSSADKTRRGGITRAGNKLVRRTLIEAAWHYLHRPHTGAALRKRQEGQPAEVIAIAQRSQIRLHRRFKRLIEQNKKAPNKAVVAIARELAGFVWAARLAGAEAA